MDKIKILHFFNRMDMGGAETFVINLYREINREKFQFDFIVTDSTKGYYDDEIKKLGGTIYVIPHPKNGLLKYIRAVESVLIDSGCDVVHSHTHMFSGINLYIAKKSRVGNRIAHSHTYSVQKESKIRRLYRLIMKKLIHNCAVFKLSCSKEAGNDLFLNNEFEIINNGIQLDRFIKKNKSKKEYKIDLGISSSTYVVGHVGAFRKEKNHNLLLKIFASYNKDNSDSILLLVGAGEKEEEIKTLAKSLGIEKKIIFAGVTNEVENLLHAMDIFVFPSLYEGLGMAIIEAQASNLPCVVSDKVPRSVNLTGHVTFLSLNDELGKWKNALTKNKIIETNVSDFNSYNISYVCKKMEILYTDKITCDQ